MKKVVPILVPVLISLILFKVLFGGGGETEEEHPEEPSPHIDLRNIDVDDHDFGSIVALDPITLNLSDNHFVKIGLALQMSADWEENPPEDTHGGGGGGHSGGDEEGPSGPPPAPLLDKTITLLGTYNMDQLSDPETRERVKAEISGWARDLYGHKGRVQVWQVYFTEFVMQ